MAVLSPTQHSSPAPTFLLTDILDALRDPIRREIVLRLSKNECLCLSFADLGSASGLSYHFNRLRTAGLTTTRKSGTCRFISLRAAEIDQAFPGLLSSILKATAAESRRALEKRSPSVAPVLSRAKGSAH